MKRLMTVACILIAIAAIVIVRQLIAGRGDSAASYVADTGQPTIVCLGDSLTAGYGASFEQSYPAWLQRRLTAAHLNYRVINAGVSGDRVADGLARLQSDVLRFHPAIVIVALGSNDPGHTPAAEWEEQLGTIVNRTEAHGTRVILGGLDEPGMGDIYRRLAARYHVPLVWFIARVATLPGDWSDAHHPNGAGYRVVMDSFWPVVYGMLTHS
jgi:acyl-CoA thioesterase I